jgi:serine phosphatase RsbU (regulator of sigma subunit)
MNSDGDEFTGARLLDVVRQNREASAAELVQQIDQAVVHHRAGFPPNDDSTILTVRITS